MAAAEARAVWQRAANRCFVQEDAKRAPKLACCQSSSTSKPVDAEPTSEADKLDHPIAGFMPHNKAPKYSDLPPGTRWWLQQQPIYGYQKGWTHEELNALESEVEMLRAGIGNSTSKFEEELETTYLGNSCEKMEMDSVGCSDSKKDSECGFDPETPWIGSEKTDPWWRVADRNELASFVAQKSHDHIQNCDLPPPQKMHVRTNPGAGLRGFNNDKIMASSFDLKAQTGAMSNMICSEQGSSHSTESHGGQWTSVEDHTQFEPGKSLRNSTFPTQNDVTKAHHLENDPSKAQLLEALRHSQTRAREAEKAAQQAYAEKEHIIKLFFRQASQLFAYKQWLQMLQLEALYLQIKNKDQSISSLFPVALPWMPSTTGKKMHKGAKNNRGKRNRPRHDIGKLAVALALGLGLVGAGLLLGWTVGWMLPSF